MLGALGPILASVAAVDIGSFVKKLKRNAMLYGIAMVFLLTAYTLGLAALAVYLGERWGLPIGLLAVAGGALVLALILIISAAMVNSAEEKRKRELAAANSRRALMVTAAASALPVITKSRSIAVLAVVGGLGFAAMKLLPPSWLGMRRTNDRDD